MTASVASFLTQAQKKGAELPPALSGTLLLAAVRLSETQRQAVRPYQLLVDDDGALELLAGDVPVGDGYAAPELRNGAVLQDDPRVLVFAAGALAYELITLTPPKLGEEGGGAEVKGALAPVIRKALAERQNRYRTLREMARAIEAVQGRPTRDEERLVLAAIAASTPLPASQKLAKLELQKAASPEAPPPPPERPAKPPPVFTQVWDPLEAQQPAAPVETAPPPPAPPPPAPPSPPPGPSEEERKERLAVRAAIDAGKRDVADLGTRINMIEEQIRASLPPALTGAGVLTREVKEMLERRCFADAERALQAPVVASDAVLQMLLGQALAGGSADGDRLERAAAAFRRAAELDKDWAEPRALLGATLWRQGKQADARAAFRSALQLDPTCAQAAAALADRRTPAAAFALSGAAGAVVAAAALLLAFRPSAPPPAAPAREPAVASAAVVPQPAAARDEGPKGEPSTVKAEAPAPAPKAAPVVQEQAPAPAPLALPPPERKAEPQPPKRARVARSEPRPDPGPAPEATPRKKPSSRAAAEAEAAKGDKALRAFDTKSAQAAFTSALKLDPTLPSAHRGMGMVYVLLGKNADAKAEYTRYLQLAPEAPDREQIARVLAR